jgi:hypothetical protein
MLKAGANGISSLFLSSDDLLQGDKFLHCLLDIMRLGWHIACMASARSLSRWTRYAHALWS